MSKSGSRDVTPYHVNFITVVLFFIAGVRVELVGILEIETQIFSCFWVNIPGKKSNNQSAVITLRVLIIRNHVRFTLLESGT